MSHKRLWLAILTAVAVFLSSAFLFTARVEASPAAPVAFELTQPDGSTVFTAHQWGDEWNHGIETIAGYSILQAPDGWWVYAGQAPDGTLAPVLQAGTPLKVGVDSPAGLTPHLRPAELVLNPHAPSVVFDEGVTAPEYQNIGSQPVLVIMVEFTNQYAAYSHISFGQMFFSAASNVSHFYNENSYGLLSLVPAVETHLIGDDGVIGPLLLLTTHPATDGTLTNDEMRQIAKDAISAANPFIDYNAFDIAPNDGYLQQWELHIFVVVAGYESSYDGSTTNAVWAHNWSLEGIGAPTHDTVVIGDANHHGSYSEAGEIHGSHMATMGVMAHELGHDLSMPDLYDTTPPGNFDSEGVGEWSIMSSGNWNYVSGYHGTSPAYLDAFLKSYQGWLTPTNVSGTLNNQSIAEAETNAVAYRLRPNPGGVDWEFHSHSGTGEYFLVENRQLIGYDAGLPGCGLLIWHIDESVSYGNDANGDENHALVWLEQADGDNDLAGVTGSPTDPGNRGDTGDPYPGSSSNDTFNYSSDPNSRLYSGTDSLVSVHVNSTTCASTMYADLTYAPAPPGIFHKYTPANTAIEQPTSLILDWQNSTGATSYDYCLETPVDGSCTTWTTGLTSSLVSVTGLLISTPYEWQVRAVNGSGSTLADGGAIWTFTTGSTVTIHYYLPAILKSITAAPASFSKTGPVKAAAGGSRIGRLRRFNHPIM
ncbi:MAG: M6 family metalloprotease domain-containing protein [Anaerolineaceae bacterium]|nr:M6 family metalloprotease domain-containing protein [Anaerolineaceae bacterium]